MKRPLITTIESLQNPRIKQAMRLRDASTRRQTGRFLIDGDREIALAEQHGIELEIVYIAAESTRLSPSHATAASQHSIAAPLQPVSQGYWAS